MDKGFKNRLARIAMCALAAIAVTGLSGCSLMTPTRDEVPPKQVRAKVTTPVIATKGVLTVALNGADAPQVIIDDEGEFTGYAVDVAYAIADRLGLKAEFVTDCDVDSIGGDDADIFLGATKEDETEDITVIGSYLQNAPALFAAESAELPSDAALSADDLSGAIVGVQESSAAQDILTSTGASVAQKTYGNVNECLEALGRDNVDYVACDATAGAYLARAHKAQFAGIIDAPETYGIAVRSSNDELIDAVQEAMDEIQADGTLEAIHIAWYGPAPVAIEDTMVSGILTSEERRQAEEGAKRAEEEAAQDGPGDDASASDGSDGDGSTSDGGREEGLPAEDSGEPSE